jgi:hypothetical protein
MSRYHVRPATALPYALAFVAAVFLAVPAAQATIIHSNVSGATVDFTGISEGSPTGDPLPLYGQPIAVGDSLVFPTTASFSATSLDGGPSDQTDGKLTFTMMAKPGYTISAFNYAEGGLVTLNAPFGGGANAFAQVIGFAAIKVLEINNSPVNVPAIQSFMTVAPLGGQYLLSSIGGDSYSTGWSGSLSVPLPAGTTKALVTLDNNLFAATLGNASRALIDKKSFDLDIDTELIPEPTTVMLGLSAFIGLSITTFRRRTIC